jgi:hypothetical protein
MIRIILASAVTAAIVAPLAGASALWSHRTDGVWCKTAKVSGQLAVLCVPETGTGYGVAISRNLLVVVDINKSQRVFSRRQP